jgi:hypothetical protein
MASTVDTSGLDRVRTRFDRIANPNPIPLMITWGRIIDEDNRKGVLAGTDHTGALMRPVSYRPVGKPGVKLTVAQRLGQAPRAKRGRYAAFGSIETGLHNNLKSSAYKLLDGPALAPRKQFSRVITNLLTRFGKLSNGIWECVGYWNDVVSEKGVPFLHWHFTGTTKLPQRDLRGLRPDGVEKARKSMRAWMIDVIRSSDRA